jgi:PII-like signaling protein
VERGLVEIQDTQIVKWWTGVEVSRAPSTREALVRSVDKGKALQIQIAEVDRWEGEPLYEAIVKRARQLGIAGASVYRGILGYGSHQELHHHHLVYHDDPILISIIDSAERIDELLAALDHMISDSCLITIAEVTVVKYVSRAQRDPVPVLPGPPPPVDGLEIGTSADVLAEGSGGAQP